jgi:transcriptional regulator GlxA family with amidase domain
MDTFLRAFRASTGLTPSHYVMRERVSRAESLLRSTRLPISEICRIVGFGSLDQLNRAFSTVKGQTPVVSDASTGT